MTKGAGLWMVLLAAAIVLGGCGGSEDNELNLSGKRVAFLVAEGVHSREMEEPMDYLRQRGAEVVVIGPTVGVVSAYDVPGKEFLVEKSLEEIVANQFDALVIPGGRSPEILRYNRKAVELVRQMDEEYRIIAAICHGPLVLAEANVIRNRQVTGTPGIRATLTAAGGQWDKKTCVRDGNLITAQGPSDIRAFGREIAIALVWPPVLRDP